MDKFGINVLTVDNPVWKRHRKVVATVLNEKISASVFHESLKQTDGMLDELFGANSQVGDSKVTARVFDMMKKITIHVLSGAGMGVSPTWRSEDDEKPKPGFRMTYIQAIKVVIDSMAGPMALPIWVLDHWPSILPGASYFRKLGLAISEFSRHTNDMLLAKRNQPKETYSQKADILTQLVAASKQAEHEEAKANNKHGSLSQEEITGNLFVFTAAGFDTTANTLSYALANLARYPQWQDWLLEEVDSIIPQGAELSPWEYTEVFPHAKRTLAFMFEQLRLAPPIIHVRISTSTFFR